MSDLHQAVELLNATIRRTLWTEDEGLFRMPKIQFIEKKLMKKADQQLQLSDIDETMLLRKIEAHEMLTYREKRAIPFVLFLDKCTMELFQAGAHAMDFQSDGQVRRLFYVYLSQYEDGSVTSLHRTKLQAVERILQTYFERSQPEHASRLLRMGFQYAQLFFGKMPTTSMMAMMLKCRGVHACYEKLGLPRGLYGCGYMRESMKKLFLFPRLSVEEKLRYLDELAGSADGDAAHSDDIYADVYPVAATGIILGVDAMKTAQKQLLKKRCIDLFYDLLGDPRFGARTIRWESVLEEARTIFLHWLAENDLNLFFRIIERTAVDDMWSYRKRFWEHYLPYITNTWVFFGKDAAYWAQQIDGNHATSYGRLDTTCAPEQSAFAFQIGPYVFVEWSHNGMLRVWKASEAPEVFGIKELDKWEVVHSHYEEAWRHAGKENHRWQNKVVTWIYENIGIK